MRSHNIDHDVIMISHATNDRIVQRRYDYRENNEVVEFSVSHQNIREYAGHRVLVRPKFGGRAACVPYGPSKEVHRE
jgi:hypothetical protein